MTFSRTDWESQVAWEENVLFPIFEQLAGKNSGATTRLLERQHAALRRLAHGPVSEFQELQRLNQSRKQTVYSFLSLQARFRGLTLGELVRRLSSERTHQNRRTSRSELVTSPRNQLISV